MCAQEMQTYNEPVAFAAIAGYLFSFVWMLPTTKAGFAADGVPWRDLLAKPCEFAMFAVIMALFTLRSKFIKTIDTHVQHR